VGEIEEGRQSDKFGESLLRADWSVNWGKIPVKAGSCKNEGKLRLAEDEEIFEPYGPRFDQ